VYIGHVQQLDLHRYDCASKHLSAPGGTYVLVKKQPPTTSPGGPDNDEERSTCDYVPLLNDWLQLLPGYRLQRGAPGPGPVGDTGRRRAQDDTRRKSQAPAAAAAAGAVKPTGSRSKPAKDRSPSKKTPRA